MRQTAEAGNPDSRQVLETGSGHTVDETGDARLVELCRQGDDDAFATLVRRYEHKLLRTLVRMVRDEDLARDLAQETFWKIYNKLDRFDTSRRFGPWVFQVGVNLCLDELRHRRAVGPSSPMLSLDRSHDRTRVGLDVARPDPQIQVELAQEVRFVLDRLPISYRTVLLLRDLEGFSTSEIAAIVRKREATVRWRLARAREQFRQIWVRRQGLEPGASALAACDEEGEAGDE